jgi:hypothetical protein
VNPFKRGDTVIVPAGTPYTYRGAFGVSKREQTVIVHRAIQGYEHQGRKVWPVIVHQGRSGYWKEVRVTPELLAANGKDVPHSD